uniref:Uncharacterized protein n=1 Tax=Alexandrium catenella TaxID=2925 RepID=A0A7S1PKI2_ALECA|mmetsp:Transcript_101705/g.270552  ORF Transcript_101705/g.270552 Transcript_101705/m.270552 type:complete len:383 (+) Transcript_101705:135-1283(+)
MDVGGSLGSVHSHSGLFGLAQQGAELMLGSLLAFVSLGQAACYHRHDLQWAEIDYFLQVRQVHIETLNNMREDLLDMYEMDGRKIDTRMIVATLLLGIGFGFVVEGTFPAPDPGDDSPKVGIYKAQHMARIVYSIFAALALLSPFWSMLALMECRRRLDFFMECFNDKFYQMLGKRFRMFLEETGSHQSMHDSNLVRFTKGLPEDSHPDLSRLYDLDFSSTERRSGMPSIRGLFGCARRAAEAEGGRRDFAHAASNIHAPGDFNIILALHSQYAQWWYDWCRRFAKIASICTWLAIIFNILCCAMLLGMYYQFNYPDTPEMWRGYSYLLLVGLVSALVLTGCAHWRGPRVVAAGKKWINSNPLPGGIPPWMNENLLDGGSDA